MSYFNGYVCTHVSALSEAGVIFPVTMHQTKYAIMGSRMIIESEDRENKGKAGLSPRF